MQSAHNQLETEDDWAIVSPYRERNPLSSVGSLHAYETKHKTRKHKVRVRGTTPTFFNALPLSGTSQSSNHIGHGFHAKHAIPINIFYECMLWHEHILTITPSS